MRKTKQPIKIVAEDFDRRFDNGDDIDPNLAPSKVSRPERALQRVNVDFPSWMVNAMDREASRLVVSRQALIKFAMDNHLQHAVPSQASMIRRRRRQTDGNDPGLQSRRQGTAQAVRSATAPGLNEHGK